VNQPVTQGDALGNWWLALTLGLLGDFEILGQSDWKILGSLLKSCVRKLN